MSLTTDDVRLVPHDALRREAETILRAAGSDQGEAERVAAHLVEANLAGHDSHGIGMLPAYVERVRGGLLVPNRHARVVRDGGALLVVDGDLGYGQVVAHEAMDLAIDRVRSTGIVALGVRNAHHMGRIGAYGEQAAQAGMVSLHFVNVVRSPPLVAPFGGSDARFATNPICIAVPGTETTPATVLDFATSRIAVGKCRVAMNRGVSVAPETLIDGLGRPTDDPSVMFREPRGAILPFGGHKGYGLGLLAELLAGAVIGAETIQPAHSRTGSIVNNMLAIVIDPAGLAGNTGWKDELDAMVDYVKASPPADGAAGPVQVPGDPERRTRVTRLAEGIPLDPRTCGELRQAAISVGAGGAFDELA